MPERNDDLSAMYRKIMPILIRRRWWILGTFFTVTAIALSVAFMMPSKFRSEATIFIQSQKIFLTVDARVQVYQYARYAFDQMERDLANVVRSSDMEFFDDIPSLPGGRSGRCDPGEEIAIRSPEDSALYNHSFTLRQPKLFTAVTDGVQYRHDSIYFKTVTSIGGQTAAALVHWQRGNPRGLELNWAKARPKLTQTTSPYWGLPLDVLILHMDGLLAGQHAGAPRLELLERH